MSATKQISEHPLVGLCQQANAALNEGLRAPAGEQATPIARAERTVSHLRDELIDRLRHDPAGEDPSALREHLNEVNASLSLIAGVEFPAGAVHKKKLRQAKKLLQSVEKNLAELSEPEA